MNKTTARPTSKLGRGSEQDRNEIRGTTRARWEGKKKKTVEQRQKRVGRGEVPRNVVNCIGKKKRR